MGDDDQSNIFRPSFGALPRWHSTTDGRIATRINTAENPSTTSDKTLVEFGPVTMSFAGMFARRTSYTLRFATQFGLIIFARWRL